MNVKEMDKDSIFNWNHIKEKEKHMLVNNSYIFHILKKIFPLFVDFFSLASVPGPTQPGKI